MEIVVLFLSWQPTSQRYRHVSGLVEQKVKPYATTPVNKNYFCVHVHQLSLLKSILGLMTSND